ncbi:LysE family translocator [Ciceribacter ferrooxidans]|uniref:LysE family translocator n=1 Tax=Ciceribacter ferrooxidans TaxID=2509717 RepID=A0A4Q2T8Y3_9HYPH|nr:LysE family translocator [Ciceribacter ferrooxidans]RYC15353.1 LysE family translocator [Ciceribacter ferrooxidans]
MPSFDVLLAFFVTTAVFAFIPGPAMLYVAARTVAADRRAGLMATLGIHLGCYAHVIAAAAGLSILFHLVPLLYLVVKLAGAAYLILLGIRMFRSRRPQSPEQPQVPAVKSAGHAFLESVTVEVLNPKTAIFFLSFLPQFVDAGATLPVWLQFLVLGTTVNLMFSFADVTCVLAAGLVTERLSRISSLQRNLQRAGGAVLVGLGLHVAFQRT